MTKAESLEQLRPFLHRYTDNVQWKNAFRLYNEVHGTKLRPDCGKCYTAVKEWLQKP